jgi:nitrogen-specific signal transduction histidine kinase
MSKAYNILDTLFEAILVVNSDGDILYYNHHLSTLSKLSPRQLKKIKNISELLNTEITVQDMVKAAKKEKILQLSPEIDVNFKDSNESCSIVIKVSPIEDQDYLVSFNDITIEKRLYDKYKAQLKELELTHNQIIQADKLTTIGEMTANISHEISNPLTIASGNLEVIESLLGEGPVSEPEMETVKTCLADITEAHKRINTIMGNMKSFLHQSESNREYASLAEIIQRTLDFISPKLEEHDVLVNFKPIQSSAVALIDAPKLEQVFVNLIKNAIDSMTKTKQRPQLSIDLEKKDNTLHIYFTDNGEGIPEEGRSKIFNAFYTTKPIGEGTGLGLAISQKIILSHRGELKLKHSNDKQTQFEIILPCIEMMSYTQNEILQGRKTDAGLKRILVVDDEVKILNLLNNMITEKDMVFIGSANPHDALKMLKELPLDLIIVDYNMPEMSGKEFAQAVREENPKIPILYMSSPDNQDKFKQDSVPLALSGMINKPFSKDDMFQAIKDALKNGGS